MFALSKDPSLLKEVVKVLSSPCPVSIMLVHFNFAHAIRSLQPGSNFDPAGHRQAARRQSLAGSLLKYSVCASAIHCMLQSSLCMIYFCAFGRAFEGRGS